MNWKSIWNFIRTDDGQKVLAFITGANKSQIGDWLIKAGTALKGGKAATLKFAAASGFKIAALMAAIAIAKNQFSRTIDEVRNVWNSDDGEIQKVWRSALEMWPPTMAIRDLEAFGNWMGRLADKKGTVYIKGVAPKDWAAVIKALKDGKITDKEYIEWMKKHNASVKGYDSIDAFLESKNADSKIKSQGHIDPNVAMQQIKKADQELAKTSGYDVRGIQAMPSSDRAKLEKEVEKMKTNKLKENKLNAPEWYYKGKADKLIAGTLTWTSVKTNTPQIPLVAFTAINVDLVLPLYESKLPIKVVSNYEALFAALRGPNTGAYSYSPEDVYIYETELKSLIARIRFLQKIIKAAHTHLIDQDDFAHILTDGIAGFNGWYTTIIQNGPSIIARLNALCEDINKWPLIGTSWISRWNYLADKCVKDYNGPKAVLGAYCLKKVPKFDSTLSAAKFKYENALNVNNINTVIANIETEYAAWKAWTNAAGHVNAMVKVAGDFIKLLGTDQGVFNNVPYLDQTQPGALTFDYDEEAKFQLQNAKIAGTDWASANACPDFGRTLTTSLVYSNETGNAVPTTLPMEYDKSKNWLVVNDSNKVRLDMNNIEMTQFVWNGEVTGHSTTGIEHTITDCSIAVFSSFLVYYYTTTGSGGATTSRYIGSYINIQSSTTYQTYLTYEQLVACRQIDFLPSPVLVSGTGASVTSRGRYIDVDNYAMMSADQIKNYVLVSAYSLSYTYSMEDVEQRRKLK